MPTAPLSPCRERGCPALVRAGYCEAHVKPAWVGSQPKPERLRGRKNQARRKRVLQRDHGVCVLCRAANRLTPATVADHIVPLAEGGADDESNLQSLCHACHRTKTSEEARRGRQRGR